MKVLLLSQNFVVNKLVTLTAQKRGDELIVAEGPDAVPKGAVDLLIVDEGVYDPALMEALGAKLTPCSMLYMGGQIREVPGEFERTLNKPFLPTDLLKLMSDIEEESCMILPDAAEAETFEPFGGDQDLNDLKELEELEETHFEEGEEAAEFDDTMFDDLEEPSVTFLEEVESSPVLDAEELEEVQHLLEAAEAPEFSEPAEEASASLNSDTLDEVNAMLEDLDLEERSDFSDVYEPEDADLDDLLSEAADEAGEASDTAAESAPEDLFEAEEPETVVTEEEGEITEEETAEEEEPDLGGFDFDEALAETEYAETETTAAVGEPFVPVTEVEETADITEDVLESGNVTDMVPEKESAESVAEELFEAEEPVMPQPDDMAFEESAAADEPEAVEPSDEVPENESAADAMSETEQEPTAVAQTEAEEPAVPEFGDVEFEEFEAAGAGEERPAAEEEAGREADASLKALEAEIESAVSSLSDEELAEELDEETLLEIVNEADKQEQLEAVSDELDRLDTTELKAALGEEEGAAGSETASEAGTVTPKEGLEALQMLVKALENETIAKSLKGMNISINISFGAERE